MVVPTNLGYLTDFRRSFLVIGICKSSYKFRKLEYFVYQTSVGTTADFVFFRCINYYRPYLTEFDKIHAKAIAAS
ncbi:hypothetical protein LEP1GSC037_5348 [Leptospira interrogans str. 2006001854]|uniref:Uncharacterized protein n=2 Tax=Leptospira interrogans TaxID=173 RepID=A0A0F6HEX1_LEPIR|nr:hypothetical protein LEP1GSC080_3292 [Leptospira interrogans str. FPW2026]EKO26907.1 hypothetical protein LEP1GSC104_1245 [Leptospira interrogans str. UI 12621]EMM82912.1 hypothetical protein LEP1GSC037_5348 [Leptospira interrogans str. 2006001854]